ncbi:MAG: hypothetical protein JJE40_10470, partial [Vicinamibacteria bacterium]|nr:hypothetical protein [Vicinamibacteria bacterium]
MRCLARSRLRAGCALVGCALTPIAAVAQQAPQPSVVIDGPVAPAVIARDANGRVTMRATRIDVPLRIDGVLDDSPYRSVASISDFIQQEPDEGQPASERTEVW